MRAIYVYFLHFICICILFDFLYCFHYFCVLGGVFLGGGGGGGGERGGGGDDKLEVREGGGGRNALRLAVGIGGGVVVGLRVYTFLDNLLGLPFGLYSVANCVC